MTEERADQAQNPTPTIETADAATGSERAVTPSVRAPFVAREHQAPPTGEPPYQRQPGDIIQADGTREPLREVDAE